MVYATNYADYSCCAILIDGVEYIGNQQTMAKSQDRKKEVKKPKKDKVKKD